jgi:phospholipid N-methyltransferase
MIAGKAKKMMASQYVFTVKWMYQPDPLNAILFSSIETARAVRRDINPSKTMRRSSTRST